MGISDFSTACVYNHNGNCWGLNNNLKVIHTLTRPTEKWKGLVGRIDKEMIQKVIPDYIERVFYICGPPKMVEAMVVILKDSNIPEKQIKQEYFPGS